MAVATASAAPLPLDDQLCFTLYATSLAMTKAYRPLLVPLGLTYPQYVVMLALWEHRQLSVGALGERVALGSGTLVPLLRKLSAQGVVERRRSPDDDRSVQIFLTPAGVRLGEQAAAVGEQVACATRLDAVGIRRLNRSLKTLRAGLLVGSGSFASVGAALAAARLHTPRGSRETGSAGTLPARRQPKSPKPLKPRKST